MTEAELKAIDDWAHGRTGNGPPHVEEERGALHCIALLVEVRRLRGLIKRVERAADCEVGSEPDGGCPWCGNTGPHVGCPAFTPDGAVR